MDLIWSLVWNWILTPSIFFSRCGFFFVQGLSSNGSYWYEQQDMKTEKKKKEKNTMNVKEIQNEKKEFKMESNPGLKSTRNLDSKSTAVNTKSINSVQFPNMH